MTLDELNKLSPLAAQRQFESCCAAEAWATAMVQGRPYSSAEQLLTRADQRWQGVNRVDILQAFSGHPRIGDIHTLHEKYAHTADQAAGEQAGMDSAEADLLQALVDLNDAYVAKFGYIFIVCASGKSAAQMLALLEQRLVNDEASEWPLAAAEQHKITTLRLHKLLA